MLRVGVVGVGSMGKNHARVYSELEKEGKVKLVGVSDANLQLAKEIAGKFETTAFKDYTELLNGKIDALSIAVPTTFHKKIALQAVRKGVSVLVEKPIADTVKNALEMINAVGKSGVVLQVGHVERFNPAVTRVKNIMDGGELGQVVSITTKRVGPYNPRIRDVGIIIDLGVHDIDVISYLFGIKVKSVFANAGNTIHSREDHAAVLLNFEGDRCGMIETNWLTSRKIRTLNVVGTGGIAYADYIKQTLEVCDKEQVKDILIERDEPLRLELESFVGCVKDGGNPIVSGEDGLYALKVAVAAMRSAENQEVMGIK